MAVLGATGYVGSHLVAYGQGAGVDLRPSLDASFGENVRAIFRPRYLGSVNGVTQIPTCVLSPEFFFDGGRKFHGILGDGKYLAGFFQETLFHKSVQIFINLF